MTPTKALGDVQNRSDHDLLVIITTKVGDLTLQVSELKDGIHTQLNDHESRIRLIERLVDQINPQERIAEGNTFRKEFYVLRDKVDDFFSRWRVYAAGGLFIAGIIGGMIQWLLTKIIFK